MNLLKKGLKTILGLVFAFLLYLTFSLVHGTITDYQPENKEELAANNKGIPSIQNDTLSFVLWNIGYGGLGAESNFFFDDGRMLHSGNLMVNAPKASVEKNVNGVQDFIKKNNYDFYLFQEVDYHSKRSQYFNQYQYFQKQLPDYSSTFASNYKVKHVPLPVFEPFNVMGKIHSGLATYSRFELKEALRLQMPGDYGWPTRIFQLDRCISIHRVSIDSSNKELVVINTHNSAYDEGGFMKKEEMDFLKDILTAEYSKKNYIIVGGDWNQCPPNFEANTFRPEMIPNEFYRFNIPVDYLEEGWTWAYDKDVPTNRMLVETYRGQEGKIFVSLLDFFLTSPNIEVLNVKGIDTDFEYSDHQPVELSIKLKR